MSFVKKTSVCFTLLLTIHVVSVAGQQRMGIAAGVVELAEGGASSVPTYCLDYSRRQPMPSENYNRVLGNSSSTVVTFGNERMSLQEAIDQHKIAIEGQHMSVGELLAFLSDPVVQRSMHLPEEIRTGAPILAEVYRNGTTAERKEIETELEPIVQNLGDHTHLQFRNLTDRKMKVEVLQNSALSARPEDRSDDLLLNGFGSAGDAKQQATIQARRWTMGLQKKLADLGYYNSEIDGVAGPNTEKAIHQFQVDRGLGPADHHETDRAAAVLIEQKRIQNSNPGLVIATLFHHPGKAERYSLSVSSGGAALSTSSMTELAAKLNEQITASSATSVVVEMEGFSPNEADAMAFNLRNGERSLNSNTDVQGVYREGDSDLESLLFSRHLTVESRDAMVEEVLDGPRKGWFQSSIDFATTIANRTKEVSLRLYAKTRALAVEWTNTVLSLITRRPSAETPTEFAVDAALSIADIIRQASSTFRARHAEITDAAFGAEVRDAINGVQIVQLSWGSIAG